MLANPYRGPILTMPAVAANPTPDRTLPKRCGNRCGHTVNSEPHLARPGSEPRSDPTGPCPRACTHSIHALTCSTTGGKWATGLAVCKSGGREGEGFFVGVAERLRRGI